jgi:hypothetical protein
VTKKDGSDFQSFAKNFENAEIVRGRICADDFEIRVSDYSIRIDGRWVDDTIDIKQIVEYSKIIPAEEQIIKESSQQKDDCICSGSNDCGKCVESAYPRN